MEQENKHVLAQFPLSIVAFPGEKVNLHIFEPRYRQLINDCMDNDSCFGIPPFYNGELTFYGTEMKVLEISKVYEDGKMDIKTLGKRIFHIHKFEKKLPTKLYPAATVSFLKSDNEGNKELADKIIESMTTLFTRLKIDKPISAFKENFSSYKIAHYVGLSMDDKIALLSVQSETKRLDLIDKHLTKFLPQIEKADEIKKRAALNGHFKNLQSPDF